MNRTGIAARTAPRREATFSISGGGVTRSVHVLNLYRWDAGDCFRCASRDVSTTFLDEVLTPIGDTYLIKACQSCVLEMEEERRRHAARRGVPYRPGALGHPCES